MGFSRAAALGVLLLTLSATVSACSDKDEEVAPTPTATSAPTPTTAPPTEPPNPFITETGVLTPIIRDFAGPGPGATADPDADKWSYVTCEADALVHIDDTGTITEVVSRGRKVQIGPGEKIQTELSFVGVPYMAHAVYRDAQGNLLLGYKYCKNEDGDIQPIASSTFTPTQ
jgi:hypothetical protein